MHSKNRIYITYGMILAALTITACGPVFAQTAKYASEFSSLLSQLESMGQGYYSDEEWQAVFDHLDRITANAEQDKDWETVVDAKVIKAMVLSDMRQDNQGALDLLEKTKEQYGRLRIPGMRKVYVREAEIYSKLGDEASVRRVIDEFKASPHFDPENYPFAGGQGRDVPLSVVRPKASGPDSISVTSMEVFRDRSQFAPGNLYPDFTAVDHKGQTVNLSDHRGKVVLVDFWVSNWTPWKRDLSYLVSTYNRYHAKGFEIIGICMDRDTAGIDDFLRSSGMSWTQIVGDTALPRKVGIFGEATNFLIDQNGVIIGRNLHGADLVEAIKNALQGS